MPKKQDSGIPYVSTKDFVEPDAIDFEGAKKIATDDFLRLSRKIKPKNGDLLISRYGTIGVVRRVTTDTPFQVSYSVAIVKPIGTRALGGYLTHALRASASQLQMRTYVRASSQPDLGLEYIRQITIALPPVAEQKRILGDLERRISMIQQLDGELATNIRRAERLRQSILKQAFEGKLVPQDATDQHP